MPSTDAHSLPDRKDADTGAMGERTAHPGSAAMQERSAIDSGLTNDKVAHTDLATSPLGTDDEAGGGTAGTDKPEPQLTNSQARDPNYANERAPRAGWVWVIIAVVAALVLGAALVTTLLG